MGIISNLPLEAILMRLIDTQSVTGKEEIISNDIFASLISLKSLTVEKIENNIIATYHSPNPRPGKKTIALVGHMDTVPKNKKQIQGFNEGIIYGRGATDMKAGLACMMKSAHEIDQGIITPKNDIVFVFYDREEGPILDNGMKKLFEQNKLNNIDFAYVLEPTEGKYAVGCMGSIIAHLHFYGHSKHSAFPWEADNAIDKSIETLARIKSLEYENGRYNYLDFRESIKMTQAATYNAPNMIPDDFRVTLDYRFGPDKTIEMAKAILTKKVYNASEIQFKDECPSSFIDLKDSEFLFPNIDKIIFGGWADSSQLIKSGKPAICYGPGSLSVAHCYDEKISKAELDNFYSKLVMHL